MKIAMVANGAWYLTNFRTGLIRELIAANHEIHCICPKDDYTEELQALGVSWIDWELSRRGMNPMAERKSVKNLTQIYEELKPQLAHHFTIKPVLYGSKAARRSKVPIVFNSVTGLGHLFTTQSVKNRLLRPFVKRWYRKALTGSNVTAFFQNTDDFRTIFSHALRPSRMVFTGGSGVPLSDSESAARHGQLGGVVFAGRLLKEKGISEFVAAAEIVKQSMPETIMTACGDIDPGNPSSVTHETLSEWKANGHVQFPGHDKNLKARLANADIVVLPSYREGTPRVLLEAAALARPLVTTDVPGCREVVDHGVNGLLVPPGDSVSLADAMMDLMNDPDRRARMGTASRQIAESRFDERIVVKKHMDEYAVAASHASGSYKDASLPRGQFCISLDLELAWGTRGRPVASQVAPLLQGTRNAIDRLLELFAKYDVAATWAVVGGLLLGRGAGNRHELLNREDLLDIPNGDCRSQPFWYADDIVEKILASPVKQEFGCHTLTHQEIGQNDRKVLRAELTGFNDVMDECGIAISPTFIYPRGIQYHEDLLDDFGFTAYRGPENKWFESLPGTKLPALMRLGDAKMGLAPPTLKPQCQHGRLWMIPSSQFYSPALRVGKYVSVGQRVRKALRGLKNAAKQNTVYHLWTHPFNLGAQTDDLISGIEQILKSAVELRSRGQLDISPMGRVAKMLGADA